MRLLALLLVLLSSNPSVRIKVDKQVFSAGDNLVVTCTVPKHASNRAIVASLPNYTYSERQLDGQAAPVTHRFEFKHVPCGVEQARCVLTNAYNESTYAALTLILTGCN